MIKIAGVEDSGVIDSGETGKQIGVSTTARIAYRKSFGDLAKQRNNIVNEYIARAFADGIMTKFFKPKQKSLLNEMGQIREVGSAKFIAIITDDAVRVVGIKGVAPNPSTLPSLQNEGDTADFDQAKANSDTSNMGAAKDALS